MGNGARTPQGAPAWGRAWLISVLWLVLSTGPITHSAHAQSPDPADQVCARFAPGSILPTPADLFSRNGVLELTFKFQTVVDARGLARYCFVTDTGLEAPTLHVSPGDQLVIHLQNDLPTMPGGSMPSMTMKHTHQTRANANSDCTGGAMGPAATNLHFHGMNVAPTCHQDDVLNTLIQPGATFDYTVQIPTDEPTGLYWYHPHPHGFSNNQVMGGAAGALIVDGIENVSPVVAGLPQRLFVLRDQPLPGPYDPQAPALDISVNYVPVPYPSYTPVIVQTPAATTEFWRVLNASSNTIIELQYVVGGVAQPMQVVAIDGVPLGQGSGQIKTVSQTSIALPPGARAEFIAITPKTGEQAQLVTQHVDTGPNGSSHPSRPMVTVVAQGGAAHSAARLAPTITTARITRFASLRDTRPDGRRMLYFSEAFSGPNPGFFITVYGQAPAVYDGSAPPRIVLHQGTTEDWTVENRSPEDHIFHIHQTRFQVLAVNGQAVNDPALRDTLAVPHWSGTGAYPSAKVRIDFRDPNIVGLFVYHCHLLLHEDGGMMGAMQALPSGVATTTTLTASAAEVSLNGKFTLTAMVAPASAGAPLQGSVQFFSDGMPVGNPVTVLNGRAILSTQMDAYGSHSLDAGYSGDNDRNQSLSAGVTLAVEDFSMNASTLKLTTGQTGTVPIAVTTSSGFSSVISFGCSLPSELKEASCTVSPNSLNGAGTLTLSVHTTAAQTSHQVAALSFVPFWFVTPAGAALAGMAFLGTLCRTRRTPVFLGLALCALALVLIGCGTAGRTDAGTPSGSYSALVTGTCGTGASSIVHSLTVPVSVQ